MLHYQLAAKRRQSSRWCDLAIAFYRQGDALEGARLLLLLHPTWYGVGVRRIQVDGSPGLLVWMDVR